MVNSGKNRLVNSQHCLFINSTTLLEEHSVIKRDRRDGRGRRRLLGDQALLGDQSLLGKRVLDRAPEETTILRSGQARIVRGTAISRHVVLARHLQQLHTRQMGELAVPVITGDLSELTVNHKQRQNACFRLDPYGVASTSTEFAGRVGQLLSQFRCSWTDVSTDARWHLSLFAQLAGCPAQKGLLSGGK